MGILSYLILIYYESENQSVISDFLWSHGLVHGILQARILEWVAFPFSRRSLQGSNPGLPHCRWILYQLNHKGSPRVLPWIANPFSKGSFEPRNLTGVSWITGRFFTNRAIREASYYTISFIKLIHFFLESLELTTYYLLAHEST